jgi:hypothetical protein
LKIARSSLRTLIYVITPGLSTTIYGLGILSKLNKYIVHKGVLL